MGRSPHNWNGYIGQGHIVPGLVRLIQGSKLRGEPLPNILIPGNSGLGKTQLVQTIATDFGTKLHLFNGRKDIDLIQLGLLAREWADGDIVFIDEGHSTWHDVQEAFYRIIDDRLAPGIETDPVTGRQKLNGTVKIAAVTILLATDQPGALLPALKKRFALVMELTPYSIRELDAIVRQRATQKSMLLKPQAARLLAKTCRGIPRTAGHRLDALAKYWGAENPSVFSTSHVRKFLHAVGIDLFGMGERSEQEAFPYPHDFSETARLGDASCELRSPTSLRWATRLRGPPTRRLHAANAPALRQPRDPVGRRSNPVAAVMSRSGKRFFKRAQRQRLSAACGDSSERGLAGMVPNCQ